MQLKKLKKIYQVYQAHKFHYHLLQLVLAGPLHLDMTLTRAKFDELTSHLS